jgi:transcriptional regulator with XRE-family HTH domain
MRRYGLTEKEIAKELGISEKTLTIWKRVYPELSTSLEEDKRMVNGRVAAAALQRATGYEYEEIKTKEVQIKQKINGKQIVLPAVQVERTIKHVPADVDAQKFWLVNRDKKNWSLKMELEHTGKDGGAIQVNQKATVNFYLPANGRDGKPNIPKGHSNQGSKQRKSKRVNGKAKKH